MKSLKERKLRQFHRHRVIRKAVEAADRIILHGSDGSVEETNYLTAEVARGMVEKALHPFNTEMLKKDLE